MNKKQFPNYKEVGSKSRRDSSPAQLQLSLSLLASSDEGNAITTLADTHKWATKSKSAMA